MQAAASGGFGERNQLQRAQSFPYHQASLRSITEFFRTLVEIEAYPIGLGKSLSSAAGHMDRDASKIDHSDLRGQSSANNVVRGTPCSAGILYRFCRRTCRHALRFLLLIEAFASQSIRATLQRKNAVIHERL